MAEGVQLCKMGREQFITYLREQMFAKFAPRATPPGTSETDYGHDVYSFDYPYRGLALIIVDEKTESTKRGYANDKRNLQTSFEGLGFDVVVLTNLTGWQMYYAAKEASTQYRHGEADCFVCVLLVHGDEFAYKADGNGVRKVDHVVLGVDKKQLPTSLITNLFKDDKCPALKDKPRIFFVQACRGEEYDAGVSVAENMRSETGAGDNAGDHELSSVIKERRNLLYQDCLIMYATPPGYYAFVRESGSEIGSWFGTELSKLLQDEEVGSKSFVRMLSYMGNEVAVNFESLPMRSKQMPVLDFNLIKDIFMTKKERTDPRN